MSIFGRSGFAALSDLQTDEWKRLFNELETAQVAFSKRESEFRDPLYKWPRDPLHTWSRCWEYPFTMLHVIRLLRQHPMQPLPVVADVGSGVTFFPFAVATIGAHVICSDIDPICTKEYSKAIPLIPCEPGRVSFRLIKGNALPYNNAEVDILYCVSVIEHLRAEEWPGLLDEFCRILKPSGRIILTVDLDLRGDSELSAHNYYELQRQIDLRFAYEQSPRSVHPANMLTSATGPHALRPSFKQMIKRRAKSVFKKSPLLGPHDAIPFYLAVEGSVYTCRPGGIACPAEM